MLDPISYPAACGRAGKRAGKAPWRSGSAAWAGVALIAYMLAQLASGAVLRAQKTLAAPASSTKSTTARQTRKLPPRALAAQRFLAERGIAPGHRGVPRSLALQSRTAAILSRSMRAVPQLSNGSSGSSATWTPLGPTAVSTPNFNLVTGRVTSIAVDPSDSTGNRVYVGTTGGGVWSSSNAGASTVSNVLFHPLTDAVTALGGVDDVSISIGALTVQPGGTGVILAGTGDPNDVLDSYYGAGILRSNDGGNTWSLIAKSSDVEQGSGTKDFFFAGEGFAGFAWSTANQQVVVAAVSDSYEGDAVDADLPAENCEGLYYSLDSGATWRLATIEDSGSAVVQSAAAPLAGPNGNAATSVVWNPLRQLFVAAIRFHGYYTSSDGMTWTRLADASQPGGGINSTLCPTNHGVPGDEGCPIYRGALAVNPVNGDTFAWTVDIDDQDQGVWQDQCSLSGGKCANASIAFGAQWNTAALETSTSEGAATIADGDYNLTLAAVSSQTSSTGSLVLAGANDLWEATAPYSLGGSWRNTTNSTTCMSAEVGEYQHALAWNAANPEEIFIGNDSGLWRSTDGIAETGAACSTASITTDAGHFQNLNGSLGSLAEVVSLSAAPANPYELMAGLGVNGTSGIDETAATFTPAANDWPQIFSGFGGPVAIDPADNNNWYVNDQPGVAIYRCSQTSPCTPSEFGTTAAVTDADVGGDGDAMPVPANFLVDPLDDTQLLAATCRLWRGPADGTVWTAANAISPVFDNASSNGPCNGDALVRSIAALTLGDGSEIVYVGMYGSATNGSLLPGHVLSAVYDPSSSSAPAWTDLTLNPVTNDTLALNYYGLDISSIVIDPHDPTGNTVYVTVEGVPNYVEDIRTVYRSTDGGSNWTTIVSNLPSAAASSLAIDPQSANTIYIATDAGVYYTPQVAQCAQRGSACWAVFGTGLPAAPAVALSASSASSPNQVLIAATYGRGIWQAPLLTAGAPLPAASVAPFSLTFASQALNSTSSAQTVTVENTGSIAFAPSQISFTGDFNESGDNCVNQPIAPGSSCTIAVVFSPQASGPRTGQMTVYANIYGGQLSIDLNGTGSAGGTVSLSPPSIDFGQIEVNTVATPESISVANSGAAVAISNLTVTPPFTIPANGNSCGTTSLAASSVCQIQVEFAPTTTGSFTGLLTLTDGQGTQSVQLAGTTLAAPTDSLNTNSLAFAATSQGAISTAQAVTITNIGGMALTGISISASGPFQETPNCNSQLAAGAVCTIGVTFLPTQLGAAAGTLTITDTNGPHPAQTVSLSGTGVAPPVFNVTPASLTFATGSVGQPSAPQTVTVANAGAASMASIGFAFTGAGASNYSVTSTTCGIVLANGASCTAQVVFTPSSAGSSVAALVVSSSTPGVASASVTINGSGQLASGLTANPTLIVFPVTAVGQPGTAQTITITNSTSSDLASVATAISAPFSIARNGCTGSLAEGASCTITVVFTPAAGGSSSGSLTISSPGLSTPATVALAGTGFDFTVSFVGTSSVTVAAGQTGNFTLLITPIGASGTFSFGCGTLPTGALCLFNPATETLNTGVQGNAEAEVSTTSAQAGLEAPHGFRTRLGRALSMACGLLFLPLAIYRRRRIFQWVLLFAVLVCGVSSCTSSGGGTGGCTGNSCGQGGGQGTPAGTYTVPVTVSANGVSHAVSVTLTVD